MILHLAILKKLGLVTDRQTNNRHSATAYTALVECHTVITGLGNTVLK